MEDVDDDKGRSEAVDEAEEVPKADEMPMGLASGTVAARAGILPAEDERDGIGCVVELKSDGSLMRDISLAWCQLSQSRPLQGLTSLAALSL